MAKQSSVPENTTRKQQAKALPIALSAPDVVELVAKPLAGTANPQQMDRRLGDARLSAIQRQTLAGQIGQMHGNQHLHYAMKQINQDRQREWMPQTKEIDSNMAADPSMIVALAQTQAIQRDGQIERPVNSVDLTPLSGNANKIKEAASKILDVATTVRQSGEHWYGNDKDKINIAANLTDMASKITSAANALDNMTGGLAGGKLEGPDEALDKATKLLRAVDFLASVDPQHPSLIAFQNDPNDFTKAAEWGTHIGDTFGKASELIPDSIAGLPGFIPQYFKGLLSAPKNYIQVFIALQEDRNKNISSETGGDYESTKQKAENDDGSVAWKGALSQIFIGCYKVDPPGLQAFMLSHRKIGGADLWKTSKAYGKALLLGAVQGVADDNARELWSNYINGS